MAASISDNATALLRKRYLNNGESVDSMFRRVADGDEEYVGLMEELRFLPNSPALFNAGLNNGCTLSACFVFNIQDSMFGPGSITETRNKAIAVAKAGGGVGYYGGFLRPKGSPIKTVQRVACGPATVLRDNHGISRLITQGGKRELAQMWVQPCWHPDVREIIHIKDDDPQSLGSFNISVGWKNDWVDKVDFPGIDAWKGGGGARLSPGPETALWWEQCEAAWAHGCPGMFFEDVVNAANPNTFLGLMLAANPCGETPNRSDEPCSLGSLSLARYWIPGRRGRGALDLDRLAHDARVATRFLNDILNRNVFPHPDITAAALLTRKLGLGVMGWADLLALCHIHYDTAEAVDFGREVMATVGAEAHRESEYLAGVEGPYPGYDEVKTQAPRRRNETSTAVAPTGTIAILADVWGSIEPHFALGEGFGESMTRTTAEGMKLSDGVARWVRDGLDGFVPKVASQIAPEWHVRHQAAFQEHTDLGVSKTINLPHSATVKDVSDAYAMMYRLKCKGGTVFRDGCRDEQVLVAGKTKSVYLLNGKGGAPAGGAPGAGAGPPPADTHRPLPPRRPSMTYKVKIAGVSVFIVVGLFPDTNRPAEVFVTTNKLGSSMEGMTASWGRLFSVALQSGVPLDRLVKKHLGVRFEPNGLTNNKDVPNCTSIPDYVVRLLAHEFLGDKAKAAEAPQSSGVFCPECGSMAYYQAGCLKCSMGNCGWTRCG